MFTLFAVMLILFLACMFLMDTLQVLLRAIATLMAAPLLGAHLGSVFMLANRVATALALLIIGYFVDSFVERRELMMLYGVAALVIALFHLPLLARTPMIGMTAAAFRLLYRKSYEKEVLDEIRLSWQDKRVFQLSVPVACITAIGLLGLLGPSLLASTYPDYRATLMQTGFIVNSLASIVNVLHVERSIAITLDAGVTSKINALYTSYTVSRALGYLIAFFSIMALFLA